MTADPQRPKFVLFDYGETLMHEEPFDSQRGYAALLEHATQNPDGLTARDLAQAGQAFYTEMGMADRDVRLTHPPLEIHQHIFNRFFSAYLGLAFDLGDEALERVYWDAAAPAVLMPGIEAVLERLDAFGIATAVVSNLSFSAATLENRIHRLLPGNHFKFILASSECVFRKPSPYIFKLALKKAGVDAEDTWFCGDNFRCDIEGAAGVGMQPIWIKDVDEVPEADFEYRHIRRWAELMPVLDGFS